MKIVSLSAVPSAASTLAHWYHTEWGYMHPGGSADVIEKELTSQLNTASLPQCYVAVNDKDEIVGAAELKFREVRKLTEYAHWLGGVYVEASFRGNGVASSLATHVQTVASNAYGIKDLYLQTEQNDGGLYARLGWQEILRLQYEPMEGGARERVVMHKQLRVCPRES